MNEISLMQSRGRLGTPCGRKGQQSRVVAGQEVVAPPAAEEPQVVNLVEALKRAFAGSASPSPADHGPHKAGGGEGECGLGSDPEETGERIGSGRVGGLS